MKTTTTRLTRNDISRLKRENLTPVEFLERMTGGTAPPILRTLADAAVHSHGEAAVMAFLVDLFDRENLSTADLAILQGQRFRQDGTIVPASGKFIRNPAGGGMLSRKKRF